MLLSYSYLRRGGFEAPEYFAHLARWQKIALEACKQCNRPAPPDLHEAAALQDLLYPAGEDRFDLKLIFWEEEGQKSLRETLGISGAIRSALILVGPEGGFSTDEVAAAVAAGFAPVSLGRRILRAETAAITAVAILKRRERHFPQEACPGLTGSGHL